MADSQYSLFEPFSYLSSSESCSDSNGKALSISYSDVDRDSRKYYLSGTGNFLLWFLVFPEIIVEFCQILLFKWGWRWEQLHMDLLLF